ncbi:hypothetical protein M9H77_17112 [Catharanthus roseus]|uniref:Uncharacterized protein n=1 Tax=Catharanthus roseus TaxID=4058 RepID=A0ACC0B3P4_CATRO|nr:hypothetical protein M9H77_17112 [Catharanthus roseus]
MEAVQRGQAASLYNMENQIELLTKMIFERPLSNIPMGTFPMFMDDENNTAQEPKESTSQGFQELVPNASEVEESKKNECLPEDKDELEKGELEKENEKFVENHEVNPLTHETNFVLFVDSLCIHESWKQTEENDEERTRLMKPKGNFENVKRKQSLCYEKARMSSSPTLTLINLLFSFKDYRISSFVQELFSWIHELKTLIQDFDLRLSDSRDDLRRRLGFNFGFKTKILSFLLLFLLLNSLIKCQFY